MRTADRPLRLTAAQVEAMQKTSVGLNGFGFPILLGSTLMRVFRNGGIDVEVLDESGAVSERAAARPAIDVAVVSEAIFAQISRRCSFLPSKAARAALADAFAAMFRHGRLSGAEPTDAFVDRLCAAAESADPDPARRRATALAVLAEINRAAAETPSAPAERENATT